MKVKWILCEIVGDKVTYILINFHSFCYIFDTQYSFYILTASIVFQIIKKYYKNIELIVHPENDRSLKKVILNWYQLLLRFIF